MNLIFVTHIYTMSITYFVLRFFEVFKTRSIAHMTGVSIYIYTLYVQDGMEFMDLLAYERNKYWSSRVCEHVTLLSVSRLAV